MSWGSSPTTPRSCGSSAHYCLSKNDEWQLQRRNMQLEGLKTVSDNQLHRVSAVVNS
jgi:hypothetical protein